LAVISRILTRPKPFADVFVSTWSAIGNADTGDYIEMPKASDRSVQVSGTFAGATVSIKGSNDGVSYFTLTDPQGNALAFTSGGLDAIVEHCRFMRPESSGGTGTAVDVIVYMRGQSE
jgi:hypothetical protein